MHITYGSFESVSISATLDGECGTGLTLLLVSTAMQTKYMLVTTVVATV